MILSPQCKTSWRHQQRLCTRFSRSYVEPCFTYLIASRSKLRSNIQPTLAVVGTLAMLGRGIASKLVSIAALTNNVLAMIGVIQMRLSTATGCRDVTMFSARTAQPWSRSCRRKRPSIYNIGSVPRRHLRERLRRPTPKQWLEHVARKLFFKTRRMLMLVTHAADLSIPDADSYSSTRWNLTMSAAIARQSARIRGGRLWTLTVSSRTSPMLLLWPSVIRRRMRPRGRSRRAPPLAF